MTQQRSGQDYPVDVIVEYPEQSSRLLALAAILFWFKAVLLIPHLIVLWVLGIVMAVVLFIGYWAVLFTGRYPRGLFDLAVGIQRWQVRAYAWLFGWTDKYPPFSLQ